MHIAPRLKFLDNHAKYVTHFKHIWLHIFGMYKYMYNYELICKALILELFYYLKMQTKRIPPQFMESMLETHS